MAVHVTRYAKTKQSNYFLKNIAGINKNTTVIEKRLWRFEKYLLNFLLDFPSPNKLAPLAKKLVRSTCSKSKYLLEYADLLTFVQQQMQREQFGEYALWYQGLHKLVKRQLHVGCVCGGGGGVVVMVHSNREKSLRHVAMVAKFVDLNKRSPASMAEKKKRKYFPVQDCTQEQNSNPYFSSGRLCQGRLLRSRNFATMVTWRQTSPLCTRLVEGT